VAYVVRGALGAAIRSGGKNGGDNYENGIIRTSGISQLLGAAELQSAPGADNPRYATVHDL